MTRQYSSTSVTTTLNLNLTASATSMSVATGTGSALLGGVSLAAGNVDQFTVAIDPDTTNEEIVFVTYASGDSFTIVRGRAGSSATTHLPGATVKHVLTSDDLTYFKNGIVTDTITAKGDLIAGTGTNTFSKLAIGTDAQVLTADSTSTTGLKWSTASTISINSQAGPTYTLVSTDNNKVVLMTNSASQTVTVPSGVFSAGNVISVVQTGTGQVTLAPGSGVTITSNAITTSSPKIRLQYSAASVICTAPNTFSIVGDLL